MRTIKRATAFRRDYRGIRAIPRYRDIDDRLTAVLELLATDQALPPNNHDHSLSGDWSGYRECHVRPDLLLIYEKPDAELSRLVRLGSHSDLFG
jgi:mRNA interferase YafQ